MEPNPCANCGAALPPAAGFCLACDTPVEGAQGGGLSVAAPEPARPVRRLPVLAAAVVGIVAVGAVTLAIVHWVGGHEAAATNQAAGNAGRALALVVDAESGRGGVCRNWADYVAGLRRDLRQECAALAGRDPGARLEDVHEDPANLSASTGTVTVHATLVDDHGSRAFARTVKIIDIGGHWRMSWDGRPLV